METMARETWTDERLDDFGKHVDQRFDGVDRRFDEVNRRFEQVDKRLDKIDAKFDRIDGRLDDIQRTMVHAMIVQTAGMIGGFIALFGLILTQT